MNGETPATGPEPAGRRPIEERLRAALQHRAGTIEPSSDGLDRIEEDLMADRSFTGNQKWWLGGLSVAAVILLVVVVFVASDSDDDADVASDSTTSEPDETTTTTDAVTSTTAPFASPVDPFGVAYPSPSTSQRFETPDAAARAYATEVLGFTELEIGDLREGDSRSGEVPVTDRPGGQETTVLVRQMEDDTWFVLASLSPDIVVDAPEAEAVISTPFDTTGTALAFEGTVNILIRAQDDPAALGEGFVTGAGTPPAGPFSGSIEFDQPVEDTAGIIVYRTLSPEDGHVLQATSFRVGLAARPGD